MRYLLTHFSKSICLNYIFYSSSGQRDARRWRCARLQPGSKWPVCADADAARQKAGNFQGIVQVGRRLS